MNKLIILLAALCVFGVGIFLYRRYKSVKATDSVGYIDVNGNVDNTRDANGNLIPVKLPPVTGNQSNNTTNLTYFKPLSFTQATAYVDDIKFSK